MADETRLLVVILWVCFCVISWSLPVVASFPPRPRFRISVKGAALVVLPQVCIVTGAPASENHPVPFLRGYPGVFYGIEVGLIALPFSKAGWEQYSNRMPLCLTILYAVLRACGAVLGPLDRRGCIGCLAVPIVAPIVAVVDVLLSVIWLLCGLLAIYDLAARKRKLVKIHRADYKDRAIVSLELSVTNSFFADAFVAGNAGTAARKRESR